jgi:cytoskeletal protein CcmA (bactofilin family)
VQFTLLRCDEREVGGTLKPSHHLTLIKKVLSMNRKKDDAVSSQQIAREVARGDEGGQRTSTPKDNWLGFVGDVSKFTGEVSFRSMLRIDGNFSGQVTSSDGTLIISNGAQVTEAVINVAVARINGTVEGDIKATRELVLGRTASVTGTVSAPALTVEDGALFNGSCRRT